METENFSQGEPQFKSKLADENLRVKIIGIGGAGGNTLDRMQLDSPERVSLAVVNTDAQALENSLIPEKVLIGRSLTRGLSTGGQARTGREAAESDLPRLRKLVDGVDLVFIIAGLGGGTGGGAAPIVAQQAAEQGALVIAFGTMPFTMEGAARQKQAEEALGMLRRYCDAVIPLPNDILLQQAPEDATVLDAFGQADVWIGRGIRSVCAMLFKTGLINVDFATLRKAFANRGGRALFGVGFGQGENAAQDALADLKACPLLQLADAPRKTDKLLVNISGGASLRIQDVNTIMAELSHAFSSRQETVMGASVDENLQDTVEISIIGTTEIHASKATTAPRTSQPQAKADAIDLPMTDALELETEEAVRGRKIPVHTSKLRRREKERLPQGEFSFAAEEDQRGYFEKTHATLIDGQDIDVPTFLRRGIKLKL